MFLKNTKNIYMKVIEQVKKEVLINQDIEIGNNPNDLHHKNQVLKEFEKVGGNLLISNPLNRFGK